MSAACAGFSAWATSSAITPTPTLASRSCVRADFPTARVCFFGHSHEQKLYEVAGAEVRELPTNAPYHLSADRHYFINAGSVDAQRKREEKFAEFAVLDATAWTIAFHRVRYDAAATEAKAALAGYRIGPL